MTIFFTPGRELELESEIVRIGDVTYYVDDEDDAWIEFPMNHPYHLIEPAIVAARLVGLEPIPDEEELPVFKPDGRLRVYLTIIMEAE